MSALLAAALHTARPFMSAWATWRQNELSSMPRPLGLPRAVADGPSADRILLIGSGPAVGWGVASHDLALPGALARALRVRTGRGAVVDVIAEPEMTAGRLAEVLAGTPLDLYDAVVTTVGTNDALRLASPREWTRRIGRALDIWNSRASRESLLLMVGIIPLRPLPIFAGAPARAVDRLSLRLNGITERLVAQQSTVRTTLLSAPHKEARDSLGRLTPGNYAFWAGQIAAELVDHLDALVADGRRPRTGATQLTSGVEDALAIAGLMAEESATLDRIVTIAAAAFHAPTAVVTVLGPDTQWHVARFGLDLESVPIEQSFCAVAVRNDDGMVVPDAPHDPRFATNPLVTGPAHLRYYAGIPIEDRQGRRIGALCVLDTKPRTTTTEADLSLLRGLAEKVANIVWEGVESGRQARSTAAPVRQPVGVITPAGDTTATPAARKERHLTLVAAVA